METERVQISVMVGYRDRFRNHQEVCQLFEMEHQNKPPVAQSTVTRLDTKRRL